MSTQDMFIKTFSLNQPNQQESKMLNKIIKFSLNNKLFILLAAILLIVSGIYTAQDMDIDVFPDLTAPTVVVMTDAHGMSEIGRAHV